MSPQQVSPQFRFVEKDVALLLRSCCPRSLNLDTRVPLTYILMHILFLRRCPSASRRSELHVRVQFSRR